MSAPASAYFLIDSKFIGPNEVEMTVNPAKAQADLATLKSRFYLDDVIGFTANYGGVMYHGFWGMVNSGGFNYNHHKASRLLEINGPKTGQILRVLNDAGLNTRGDIYISAVLSNRVNLLRIEIAITTPYYQNVTEWGFKYDVGGGYITLPQWDGDIPKQTQSSDTKEITDVEISEDNEGNLIWPATVNVIAYVSNSEGTFESEPVAISTSAPIWKRTCDKYVGANDAEGEEVEFYMLMQEYVDVFEGLTGTPASNNYYAYKDEALTVPIDDGYYGFFSDGVKRAVASDGRFTHYINYVPVEDAKNFDIYLEYDDETVYIEMYLNDIQSTNVIVTGTVQCYAANGLALTNPDSGNFTITITPGNDYADPYINFSLAQDTGYIQAIITSVTPSGLTYNSHKTNV